LPEGAVTSQIAHDLSIVLFPVADVVIDIHSGGRSMEFVPCRRRPSCRNPRACVHVGCVRPQRSRSPGCLHDVFVAPARPLHGRRVAWPQRLDADGMLAIPAGPGLGVELDRAAVAGSTGDARLW